MKKFSFLSALLMLLSLSAMAQESLSIGEVLVPRGKQTMIPVMFHFNEGHDYVSYQFTMKLPNGISYVADEYGQVMTELGDGQSKVLYSKDMPARNGIMKAWSNPSTIITTNEGVLVYIPVTADESLEVGTVLNGTVSGIVFSHKNAVAEYSFQNFSFSLKIADKIILDENNSWTPFATDAACDLLVKRTIKAGEWNSICFPFAMSVEKLKAAFGEGYDLEEFTGYDVERDADKRVTGLRLNFTKNDKAAKINTPYLIKTKLNHDITEFELNARLNPGNTKKAIMVEDEDTGEEVEVASMTGIYKAGTLIPAKSLFLSGNKFYYSVGKTPMQGFRAYFTLSDVLAETAEAKACVILSIDGESIPTSIHALDADDDDDGWYTVSGMKLNKKPTAAGVYIHQGKKVVINDQKRK